MNRFEYIIIYFIILHIHKLNISDLVVYINIYTGIIYRLPCYIYSL